MGVVTVDQATSARTFERVLVGVDGSDASREAVRQAARLLVRGGTLELASAIYLVDAALQGWPEERIDRLLEREAGPKLRAAAAIAGPRATRTCLNGPPHEALLEEATRFGATLLAVGGHRHLRLSELLLGSVAATVVRDAACSVLVARPSSIGGYFPSRVVVGFDGSPESDAALATARSLCRRFGAAVQPVFARRHGGTVPDLVLGAAGAEVVEGRVVETLLAAAASADLLVVGSRGLHGMQSLGSVSERVAHGAACSVLVVRPARD